MYTQEIVCPMCGEMTKVNVADGKGTIKTPCQNKKCRQKITVKTDADGKVVDIRKSIMFD